MCLWMPAVLPQVVVTAASLIWPSQVSFLGACKGRIHAGVLLWNSPNFNTVKQHFIHLGFCRYTCFYFRIPQLFLSLRAFFKTRLLHSYTHNASTLSDSTSPTLLFVVAVFDHAWEWFQVQWTLLIFLLIVLSLISAIIWPHFFLSKSPFWDSRLCCDYKMATLPSIKVLQSCVDPGMGISVCLQVLCWPHQGHQYRSFSIVLTMSRTSVYALKSYVDHLKGISIGPLVLCWPCQGHQCIYLGLALTTSKTVLCWPHERYQHRSFSIVLTMTRTSVYILILGLALTTSKTVLCWPHQRYQCRSFSIVLTMTSVYILRLRSCVDHIKDCRVLTTSKVSAQVL